MDKSLLIVFVKNNALGKAKTRLAKTIGDQAAFNIYQELVSITEKETQKLTVDRHIYFSETIDSSLWEGDAAFIQQGADLGEKMLNAFKNGFVKGYNNIVLIGSDLPSITNKLLETAFEQLNNNQIVFGPAQDGGYYLIGLATLKEYLFIKKPWSTSNLLAVTLQEVTDQEDSVSLLKTHNDIDTYEDLINSDFYNNNPKIQQCISQIPSTSND